MSYAKTLPGRILEIVGSPRWGGGLRRIELARMVGRPATDKEFKAAIWMLYGSRRIDFIRDYIVATIERTTP